MAQWFRFYNTALDDPKVQSLPPDIFKFWINILCLACRNDGKIPSIADCAFALRTEETVVLTVLERLSNATLIDRCNGGVNGWHITPHNWHKWQYKSDTSTERVKRFRNVAETANETHQRQKQNTDTEKKEGAKAPSCDSDETKLAFDAWNDLAKEGSFPTAQRLTETRKTSLRHRLAECGGIDGWRTALGKVRDSPHLRGENDRGWRADLDFVLTASKFTKIMEGSYDGTSRKNGRATRSEGFAMVHAAIDELRRRENGSGGGGG